MKRIPVITLSILMCAAAVAEAQTAATAASKPRRPSTKPASTRVALPKQQPASRQPMRPKPRPIGTTMPAMSAAFQNGNRSERSKNHAAIEAPRKPP